jgi:hypothetical protein
MEVNTVHGTIIYDNETWQKTQWKILKLPNLKLLNQNTVLWKRHMKMM